MSAEFDCASIGSTRTGLSGAARRGERPRSQQHATPTASSEPPSLATGRSDGSRGPPRCQAVYRGHHPRGPTRRATSSSPGPPWCDKGKIERERAEVDERHESEREACLPAKLLPRPRPWPRLVLLSRPFSSICACLVAVWRHGDARRAGGGTTASGRRPCGGHWTRRP